MKRSKSIRLVLIGGLTAGALAGCTPAQAPVSTEAVYTNNCFVPGVGYYHAPFRGFYPLPYNHYDPQTKRYFAGGQWGAEPFENITNLSSPPLEVAAQAQSQRTDVPRGGFGGTSYHHSSWGTFS